MLKSLETAALPPNRNTHTHTTLCCWARTLPCKFPGSGTNKEIHTILIYHHWVSFITLTKASLQSEACSELRGLVTRSLLVMKERWVKHVAREVFWTCRKQTKTVIISCCRIMICHCVSKKVNIKCSPPAVTLRCWSVLTCWHHWFPSYFVCWLVGTQDQI